MARSKPNQEPNGLGLERKKIIQQYAVLTITFTGDQEKKRLSSAKKKKSQNGVCHWGDALQQISTQVAGGV